MNALIQVQAQIIYVDSIHFAFKGQLSNLINFRYSLHENPILFPQKIEQLWFAKPFFSIF